MRARFERRSPQPFFDARERFVLSGLRAENELGDRGRLVIRKSGTEPLIRVMAEGDDPAMVERLVDRICEAVAAA